MPVSALPHSQTEGTVLQILDGRGLVLPTAASVALFGWIAWAEPAGYDELPEGSPEHVAQFYYSALALPGVGEWGPGRRLALLDAATLRYRDRLVDRASWPSADAALRHMGRLAASDAMNHHQLAQACAQYGVLRGPCVEHAGWYELLARPSATCGAVGELLAQGRLTLDGLEKELAGASRPGLSDPR